MIIYIKLTYFKHKITTTINYKNTYFIKKYNCGI